MQLFSSSNILRPITKQESLYPEAVQVLDWYPAIHFLIKMDQGCQPHINHVFNSRVKSVWKLSRNCPRNSGSLEEKVSARG